MIVSTTTAIDSMPVSEYVGVVTGEAVLGANVFRDLFAGLRDIVGGRSAGYERSLREARQTAIDEMVAEAEQAGAEAVIGVDVDYESIQVGQGGSSSWSAPLGPQSNCSVQAIVPGELSSRDPDPVS